MMYSGRKGTNISSKFKWKWHGDSSLTAGLLKDVPPEIELSEYGRIPSPGSESPSALLNGESSLSLEPIPDLDLFLHGVYNYHLGNGLWCIIIKWIVELLGLGFIIFFSGFFLLFVDWDGLRNAKCGIDAVESGTKPCDLAVEALHQHPLSPLTITKAVIVGYLGIFSIYLIFCFLRFFAQLKDILRIRRFYNNSLHVTDSELQTTPWPAILEKVVELQSSQKLSVVKDLSEHDIMMRLMRKENIMIGMVNKGVLAFEIPAWFPGAGPSVNGSNGRKNRLILTKTLEWTFNWCVLESMFDRNYCIRGDFSNPGALRKRFQLVALAWLVLQPFLAIFVLVFFFLRHAEQMYNHPMTASSRRWSNLSKWLLREFNEADHLFRHRLNNSSPHASDYLRQFPSPIISTIAKFISFVSGGITGILLMIAVFDESLLEGHILGRNLFWYAAVFGAITAISRNAISNEPLVRDPEGEMSRVVQHTHYMPKRWRGKEHTKEVRREFGTLFQYTGMMLLEEIASIFFTPYLLFFVVPKRVDGILQFIADSTVHVEGVGHVCRFSVFDFQNHGNSNYGSIRHSPRSKRSSQGKMEKSFLSFQSSYPSWKPDPQGKELLSNLRAFRDQMLQEGTHAYAPPRVWPGNLNLRRYGDQNTRVLQQDVVETGNHLGSLWLIDIGQRDHPYLLDWYYTSRLGNVNITGHSGEDQLTTQGSNLQKGNVWTMPEFPNYELSHGGGFWHHNLIKDQPETLPGPTTPPLFKESMFEQQDTSRNSGQPSTSQWWARSHRNTTQVQASFIDPPSVFHNRALSNNNCSDSCSDRSIEEEWQENENLDWRITQQLSRTTYLEDLEAGDVSLHFDNIFSNPPETPRMNIGSSSAGW